MEDFVDVDIKQIKVPNSRIALADMATNFYKNPSREMNVIGITATNGKTTTAFMVASHDRGLALAVCIDIGHIHGFCIF